MEADISILLETGHFYFALTPSSHRHVPNHPLLINYLSRWTSADRNYAHRGTRLSLRYSNCARLPFTPFRVKRWPLQGDVVSDEIGLFVAQSDHGVHAHGAARGDVARD
jgi:hypothetical protein